MSLMKSFIELYLKKGTTIDNTYSKIVRTIYIERASTYQSHNLDYNMIVVESLNRREADDCPTW